MARIIITTSNNLAFDNRVHKITTSLLKMGFEVWKTGRNYPKLKTDIQRPGHLVLFNLPVNKGPVFYLLLNIYTFIFLLFHKFDIIWSVDMDTLPAGRMAGFIKRKPVIFDAHEIFSELPEIHHKSRVKKTWKLLEEYLVPGCNLHFTVSPGLVKFYKETCNSNFHLLRNLPLRTENPKTPILKADKPKILYQGALNVGRGIAETIRAMKYLPAYEFVIVGKGDCTDELKNLVHELKLEEQVKFIGAVPFEQLHEYQEDVLAGICIYQEMGLNHYYSLPNRLFDYIQAGIPVITTNFPDMAEIVGDNNAGLVIDTLDPREIASHIREACENTKLRETWQKTIPEAARKFTWENEEKAMEKVKQLV